MSLRRAVAALAVAGAVALPLAGCTAEPPAQQPGTLPTFCAAPTGSADVSICKRFRSVYPSATIPKTTPPTTQANAAPAQQHGKKGGGIPVWVWVIGGVVVLGVGYRLLAGQGGPTPAHAGYTPPPQPLRYSDYDFDDFEDYEEFEPEAVVEYPESPTAPPQSESAAGSSLMEGWDK